jgi:hypothetical protein
VAETRSRFDKKIDQIEMYKEQGGLEVMLQILKCLLIISAGASAILAEVCTIFLSLFRQMTGQHLG